MSHPTNDPNLPSFLHPIAREAIGDLDLVQKIWDGLRDCKSEFLPKELREPPRAYAARLNRTAFDDRFSPAIESHAGLLSNFETADDVAQSFAEAQSNIDLQGNDFKTFMDRVDRAALRDGGAAILIEYQSADESIRTGLQERQSGRRPYFVQIDRRNILNWQIDYDNGKPRLGQVVYRSTRLVADGAFGSKFETVYNVLYPGRWEIWAITENQGKFQTILLESGETSLLEIPIAWYSYSAIGWFEGDLPFLNLANLNIEHFQKRSDLNEVLHKCNLPVPVRKGVQRDPATQQLPPLAIGPNSVVDVGVDGDFRFAEPTGAAITASQADIAKLEQSMDRMALAFISGGEAQKTATEVILDSAQIQSRLNGLARRKESMADELLRLWVSYTGERYRSPIKIDEKIIAQPATPQDIQLILDAIDVQIDRETGLQMLIDRQWLAPGTKIEDILERLRPEVPIEQDF